MLELPEGAITLLFTDIEGSTRILHRLGERYAEVLAEHRRLLRAACTAHGGHEVDTQGDSFFIVFAQAQAAVAAAVAAQRALHEYPWTPGNAVRVRMSLHTGQPLRTPGGYVGLDVHHGWRLMAAAHGGQVLLSETTREAVGAHLPAGVQVQAMGRHQLKDMAHPESIYQLAIAGLPADFPPLKTIDLRPNNLPAPVTELIGRAEEVATATRLLRQATVRLLTFTGVGGTGKTRLSLQVAVNLLGDFEDGVFFVALATLRDPDLVIPTLAATLGVPEVTGRSLLDSLKAYLKNRQMLLVLDNFEQVAAAATLVAELLAASRGLKVLVTSRSVLHLRGEHELPVPPLAVPPLDVPPLERAPLEGSPLTGSRLRHLPSAQALTQYAAVELFIQRAQAVKPSFSLDAENAAPVAAICTRLDGLPLAIELAAPRLRLMSPEALVTRLESRFKLLTDGARDLPERHQTLRECIAWSYGLLDEPEQALFRRLAVFSGSFTAEAAAAIIRATNLDATSSQAVSSQATSSRATSSRATQPVDVDVVSGLASLVEQSLLHRVPSNAAPRFELLETICEFALEQLEAREETPLWRRQHAAFFLELAQQAASQLTGPTQSQWLQRLDQEQDNLRAALSWSLALEPLRALAVAGVLWPYWELRGHFAEGRHWLQEALARNAAAPDTLRARALCGAGKLAYMQGDFTAADDFFQRSLQVARAADDQRSIAQALLHRGRLLSYQQGVSEEAAAHLTESLELLRRQGDRAGIALALLHLSLQSTSRLDFAGAQQLLTESLEISRELKDDHSAVQALFFLGDALMTGGAWQEAALRFEEALDLARRCGNMSIIPSIQWGLSHTEREAGNFHAAQVHVREALLRVHEFENTWGVIYALESMGLLAAAQRQSGRAARLLGAVDAWRSAIQFPLAPGYRLLYDGYLNQMRATGGAAEFEAAWQEGHAMPPEQAVRYALAATDAVPKAPS